MKLILLFCTLFMLLSCGSSQKITDKPETHPQETGVIKIDESIPQTRGALESDSITKKLEVPKEKVEEEQTNQLLKAEVIDIYKDWNELLQKHVSKKGVVDYKGFKSDRSKLLAFLKQLNLTLPKETDYKAYTLAYWINAYNAFTIDLILRHYPIKSIKDIKKPWEQRYWKLGEKWYNLNDIEHEILRKMNEPRIHFAIVCASVSCPKLQNIAFTASEIEKHLTDSTREFLNDDTRNSISKNNLELSKIFQWFAKDFKKNGSLIDLLNQYSDIEISAKAKKSYKDYNWDLNE